jgi:hypothetical protein
MPEAPCKTFGTFTLPFRISQHGHDPAPDSDTPGNTNWPALGWRCDKQAKSRPRTQARPRVDGNV